MAEDRVVMMAAGQYSDIEDARADFRRIKDMHQAGQIGRYDASVVTKTTEGKIKITDSYESGTQKGAVGGAVVGGLLGLLFPPSMIVSAGVGAMIGGGGGHLFTGISKGRLEDIGETLQSGEAGLVLIAEAEPGSMLESVLDLAIRREVQQVSDDVSDYDRAVEEAHARV